MVDHFISFKGCRSHSHIEDDSTISMKEFVENRCELLKEIPLFREPDFARGNDASVYSQSMDDEEEENEEEADKNQSRVSSGAPLSHMTPNQWKECCNVVGKILCDEDASKEGDCEAKRCLKVGKDDVLSSGSSRKRKMARGITTLDIDSVLGLFSDLSAVKSTIAISIIANPLKNLKSSVHIEHNGVQLHEIPHFHLGRFGNDLGFDLFVFLPALLQRRSKRQRSNLFNRVPKTVRAEFMNKCLLPAIRETLNPTERQSWDFAYELVEAKVNAHRLEGRRLRGKNRRSNKYIYNDLDSRHIQRVWDLCNCKLQMEMRRNSSLKAFKGFQFFVNSKAHKHRTCTDEFQDLMKIFEKKVHSLKEKFNEQVESNFDMSKMDENRFWIDLGIIVTASEEMEKRYGGHTWSWSLCCLDEAAKAFQMKEETGRKPVAVKYHWCLTRDIGNMTITATRGSFMAKGGLEYLQWYGLNKLQHDAVKVFPWGNNDDTMVTMALDQNHREAMRSVMGGIEEDLATCRQSYNHSGRRYVLASDLNKDRSWGVREEYRISLTLLRAIALELDHRGNPELRQAKTPAPFYVHPTPLVNQFSKVVALPIASWYQETLGFAPEGMLGIDRQKLAILQSFLLKNAWGNSLLCQNPFLWEKKMKCSETQETIKVGLGLKESIEKYGLGWLPSHMFDWKANSFAEGVADRFPFPIKQLEKHYQKRRRERKTMMNLIQKMDQAIVRLQVTKDDNKRMHLLSWMSMTVLRQYIQDVWEALYQSQCEFKGKESERGRQSENQRDNVDSEVEIARGQKRKRGTTKKTKAVIKNWIEPPALTYDSVRSELEEEPLPVGKGKDYKCRNDYFDLLFLQDDFASLGQGWKNKPYLHALSKLRLHLDREDYDVVLTRLRLLFNQTCHCIPNASRDPWLLTSGPSKSNIRWIAFDAGGKRIPCGLEGRHAFEEGSSWLKSSSMHEDPYWNVALEEVLEWS